MLRKGIKLNNLRLVGSVVIVKEQHVSIFQNCRLVLAFPESAHGPDNGLGIQIDNADGVEASYGNQDVSFAEGW